MLSFREQVADFISARDGHPSLPGNIFLTNGASSGIQACLTGLIGEKEKNMSPPPRFFLEISDPVIHLLQPRATTVS